MLRIEAIWPAISQSMPKVNLKINSDKKKAEVNIGIPKIIREIIVELHNLIKDWFCEFINEAL